MCSPVDFRRSAPACCPHTCRSDPPKPLPGSARAACCASPCRAPADARPATAAHSMRRPRIRVQHPELVGLLARGSQEMCECGGAGCHRPAVLHMMHPWECLTACSLLITFLSTDACNGQQVAHGREAGGCSGRCSGRQRAEHLRRSAGRVLPACAAPCAAILMPQHPTWAVARRRRRACACPRPPLQALPAWAQTHSSQVSSMPRLQSRRCR